MIDKLFEELLYVKVSKNMFEIIKVSGEPVVEVITSLEPFTTRRLLVGEFSLAEHLLITGVKKVLPRRLIKRKPAILIHPLEMVEGGLSEVERRVLREVAVSAGAHKVEVWVGDELNPHQVIEKLKNA
jgi:hypothetical protein